MKHGRGQLTRRVRSSAFLACFGAYALVVMELGHRFVIMPAIRLFPAKRAAIIRALLRMHAHATLGMARVLAGVRVHVRGAIPAESCVVVMNHQSVLDIPLGVWLVPGPQVLIPTRVRYGRGIPGISTLVRLSEFPTVAQGRTMTREELEGLTTAAERVGRGERTLLIFPEGHRTRDGSIGRFMRSGLRITFAHARKPVYCVVADGMMRARTTTDALAGFANTDIRVSILGPFSPPADPTAEAVDAFGEQLHSRMTEALADLRAGRD